MPAGPIAVTVDACELGGASGNRGIGTYLREVLLRLADDDGISIRALTTAPTTLPAGVDPVVVRRVAPGRWRSREHELLLPRDLRRADGDVVWSPGQDPPRRCRAPFVQTLHDVTPLRFPHPDLAEGAARLRRLAPRFRAATNWIANSAYTADSCAEDLGLPRDRIEVALLGVDDRFRPPQQREPSAAPYLLYVGEYGPHKGLAEAFAVAGTLAERGLPHRLRVVSRIAPWWRPRIDQLLAAAPRPDVVDIAGFVDDIVDAYQQADALVFTSRHEGFGLPLVEAMACATPVVAFANSSVPEVLGDGGTLVADGAVAAMADALEAILRDRTAWTTASERAAARAAGFRWERTAATHAAVLRGAAATATAAGPPPAARRRGRR